MKGSTINRDLRFLAQILKQAERERCLARSPFDRTKFFVNESRDRRKPHILSWEEQEKLLAVASPRLRVFVVLGVETGMRTGEMLKLQWKDIDFLNDVLQVGRSKSNAGIRAVPISGQCKAELLRWRNLIGPEFSEWVFPNFENRRHPLQRGGRKAWANALKKAGSTVFPNLLPASHVCLAVDERGCVAAHDCPDAGTFIDTDRSPICAGSGSESTRCDEEIGSAEEIGRSAATRLLNQRRMKPSREYGSSRVGRN